jgi:hypothetical protein
VCRPYSCFESEARGVLLSFTIVSFVSLDSWTVLIASGVHTPKAAVVLGALEIESVLLTSTSRWSRAGAPGVGLIDALFVAPSDNVLMFWTYITESHPTVDTDLESTT